MAESNPTQVILTDDGIKIIKAQNTANNAASEVTNLNDPNLMSVIEKQNNIGQFAGLTSQYNVLVQNAKDDGINTTAVATAYNNLNRFMADILADPDHASDVDRVTYKKYQDAYNQELVNLQSALQNNTNNKFTSAASAESQAAIATSQAFSQAQSAVDYADSAIAVQSGATAKAQSAADNAFAKAESTASAFGPVSKKADSAFDNALSAQNDASNAVAQASFAVADSKDAKQIAGAVSQSYKTLTNGSTMTIAELQNGLAAKLTKTDLDGYATQTWAQNQIKLTADGINGTISSVKTTVDGHDTSINELKADSSSFKTQFTTVNDTISKHSTDIGNLQASSKSLSASFDSLSSDNKTNQHDIGQLQASAKTFNSTLTTVQTQVQNSAVGTNLIVQSKLKNGYLDPSTGSVHSSSIDFNSDYIATNGETVFTFSSPDYVFKGNGADDRIAMYDSNKNYLGYQALASAIQTLSKSNVAYIRFSINSQLEGNTTRNSSDWLANHRYKLEKGSVATDYSVNPADTATQSQISQLSGDINLRVTKNGLIDQINIQADKTLISSSGQLTLSGKNIYFDSTNPVIIPSANIDKLLVGKKLTAADISANTFTTNNGTFTVDKNGLVTATSLVIRGSTNLVYNASLSGANGTYIPGWTVGNGGGCWISNTHDGVPSIGFHSNTGSGVWNVFAQTKLHPLNGDVYQPFSASVWFKEYGSDTSLLWNLTLAFFDSNGNRIEGAYVGSNWNGIGSEQDWSYVTVENVTPPSNAIYVGLQYYSYNGNGNACFSSPMLTQTAQATGYQPDTGNIVNAGIINGSTINASTINGSTINGGTLNMQTDGLINSPYTGIVQTADNFYHPWKLNTGQLTIGQGYITSVSSGTRSINGVPKQFNHVQGTLSASYLKFTNDYGARTYIDADMFTYSNQTNDTAMVAISASGIGIDMGTPHAPALTISSGYIDASSSSSYGKFGAMTLGYSSHTINSDGSLFFESGLGSGNPGINIWAKGFHSLSSRLSTKRQVRLLDDEHSNSLLLGADTATFQYNQDTNADNSNEGVIIDDVNKDKQYSLPDELITRDGKAPTDLMSFIARIISQNKYQARLIEDLQIRLRKVEIENE
ncbi:hypothetical protein [Lactiplantibacillus pentosus]|uniref:hypothetical protein n=1 Tax=Lactiplantibacillus pentosus TaxID=1589 RepID=UPI00376F8585